MAKTKAEILAFNRGLISRLALARTDVDRTALSAETMTNYMPRRLGSMMFRPGTAYLGSTASDNAGKFVPFVYSSTDTALLEFTNDLLRVWVNDTPISRASVTATVTNSGFDSNLTGWTDTDEAGATSAWVTGGYMGLTGTSTGEAAIRRQEVTVTETGTEHALDIVIERGPVSLKVGSSGGAEDYIAEVSLGTGSHSLSFTPTGNFWIDLFAREPRQLLVDSCAVASSGVMTLTAPYAAADLSKIRWDQSADVVYLAADGYQQYKIERRGTTSWSLVKYEAEDGPFRAINVTDITLTPSALTGNITLTASRDFFTSANAGSLFRLTSTGQEVTASISTEDNYTNTIKVTGVTTSRIFTIIRAGTWSATVTLQRSLTSDTGPWEDVTTYTTNGTLTYDDTLDNQTAWYRIGVKTGDFDSDTIDGITLSGTDPVSINMNGHPFATGEQVSFSGVGGTTELNGNTYTITVTDANNYTLDGTDSSAFSAWTSGGTGTSAGPVSLTLDYPIGSIDGIVRVTSYTNATTVNAEVLTALGGTDATEDWYEGEWSSRRGYPTSVALAEGRLAWAGNARVWLSVSDAYESYDDSTIGDSGPITRTIGSGPVDNVNWMAAVERLLFGTDSAEWAIRSSSEDEILTPSNANPKRFSTQGSATVNVAVRDDAALWVQQGGAKLMESALSQTNRYATEDLTTLYPEAGEASPFVRMAIQRKPDTRVHCVREDGIVPVLVHSKAEDVLCWCVMETGDGAVVEADSETGEYWGITTTTATTSTTTDITELTYDNKSKQVTNPDSSTEGVHFKSDGTKMYVAGSGTGPTHKVYQYSLSTAWDISTATEDSIELDIDPQMDECTGLWIDSSGTRMYIIALSSDVGYQYTMSTAWDLSTASYASKSYNFQGDSTQALGLAWKSDGTKLYLADNANDKILQYSAGTAWDISTLSKDATELDTSGETTLAGPRAIRFNDIGTRIFIATLDAGATGRVVQYDLSTAWDLTSATAFDAVEPTEIAVPWAFDITASGDTFYIHGGNVGGADTIYQYSVTVTVTTVESTSFISESSSTPSYIDPETGVSTMLVEDVVVLPGGDGSSEDSVYYLVNRDIGGTTKRYLEKWSLESECQGGTINKCVDSHVLGTITSGVMTGLSHLEGKQVSVWVNGKDIGRYTVSSGQITGLTEDGDNACAGVVYTARWRSTKLGELTELQRTAKVGLILDSTHYQGLKYGPDFNNLDNMPLVEDGTALAADTVHSQYDKRGITLDGSWTSDTRLALQSQSPRPCTILAAIVDVEG